MGRAPEGKAKTWALVRRFLSFFYSDADGYSIARCSRLRLLSTRKADRQTFVVEAKVHGGSPEKLSMITDVNVDHDAMSEVS